MNEDNVADTSTDVEQSSCYAPDGEKEAQRFDTPVRIHIHSARNRLADHDGVSGKAVIDGLVKAGLLADDTPEQVKEVSYSQSKTRGEEYTEITVTPCE